MKSGFVICLLGLGPLASCKDKDPSAAADMSEEKIPGGKERAAKAAETVRPALERDLAAAGLKFGDPVFIRAFKRERQLDFHVRNRASGKFELFRTYKIAGMSGHLGPKLAEGDGQVPEGFYLVPSAAMNPASRYHLSFNIGYPNAFDRARKRTGSAIMIHGNRVSIGCLAMTDEKIEEIYTLSAAAHAGGQVAFRVHLFPARMTTEWMLKTAAEPDAEFWKNLREGYDYFEKNGTPPEVTVVGGRYAFQ
jgi:murein L,D-transpeptidase YafK